MIETNMQQQQQDTIFQQLSHPQIEAQTVAEASHTIACSICDAVYAHSPQQALFLQYEQGALESTFMGMCHFCFRCRRAACPQCWDDVHGVCGSCVQEAGLPFRAAATPLDGLVFPPATSASSLSAQAQSNSLLVLLHNGRFYREIQAKPALAPTDITTEHPPAIVHTDAPDSRKVGRQPDDMSVAIDTAAIKPGENHVTDGNQLDTLATRVVSMEIAMSEAPQEMDRQEEASRTAKKAKKVSRLELGLTWIVLVIVVVLVVMIVLAEFIPAVNAAIMHVTHIDIRGEIAYLVHIVQQLFKR